MQSGISVSERLVDRFRELVVDKSQFGLLVNITGESLEPGQLLVPASGGAGTGAAASFAQRLPLLAQHLKADEALYALLRRHDEEPAQFVAVTYVPDRAPVRQKMLFASTRLALTRQLGAEHFRESLFANSESELTAEGFARHDAHQRLAAPLTEEERELGAVREADREAASGGGMKAIHMSSQLNMPMADGVLDSLRRLSDGSLGVVMLKIQVESETVVEAPETPDGRPDSLSALMEAVSVEEPRFVLYRFVHRHDGVETSPVLFIYTCPATATKSIKRRMMYPLMKGAVLSAAEKCGVRVERRFEVEDPAELEEKSVLDELHPKPASARAFARPRRPGR